MSGLFGVELPTPVNFVIAFVFVLLLIGAAAWLVRRFGATRTEAALTRGRQPRLAVVDFATIDNRRKLVIIRRDNVEHLVMIGGPSDVVVETNIVRAASAANRDAPTARNGADPARPGAVPDLTQWPLQPETAPAIPPPMTPAPSRADRAARLPSDEAWQTPVEPIPPPPPPEVRPVRPADTLAGLADDLARPTEPVPVRPVQVQPARLATPIPSPIPAPIATDQSLAEMAQRLEAALRRPGAQKVVTETQRVTATVEVKAAPPKAATPARSSAQAITEQQADLEQEMASLLSKPGKT